MVVSLVLGALIVAPIAASSLVAGSPAVRHALGQKKARHARRAVPVRLIRRFRHETWRWQALMGAPQTQGTTAVTFHALVFWRAQARRARRSGLHPPHRAAWLCLHRYEGSWRDSGGTYWGGLQMDRGFMSTYAPRQLLRRGWANRWTPLEQMWVAERALRRGVTFHAWPTTARICGLI